MLSQIKRGTREILLFSFPLVLVPQLCHIGGLKDLQALCKCRTDATGAGLVGFGIPPVKSEEGSPHNQECLFSQTDLSEDDLNNKNMVIFTFKCPCYS